MIMNWKDYWKLTYEVVDVETGENWSRIEQQQIKKETGMELEKSESYQMEQIMNEIKME